MNRLNVFHVSCLICIFYICFRLRNMGQDYSYTQPSSSEDSSLDITSLLQAEADIYADEAQSMHNISEPYNYPPQKLTMESRRLATVVLTLLLLHRTQAKTQAEGTSRVRTPMMETATSGNGGM